MNYLDLTIEEIHKAIVENKVSPKELVLEAISRAKNDTNNAFEYICEKEAIEQVNNLDPKKKNNLLWGIPYTAKDNYSTKNIPTTASSNILNGYVPIFDAEVINRLNSQGAILIGKTTMDELAMGGTGTTGHKGTTYNPWDKTHTHLIGGSSCGSAASVADSIVPFSLGSDTGDSVRKPASNAALVGLKPTWGRISRFGLFPFAPSMDHVGFFTRSVSDCNLLLKTLSGRDEKDMTSSLKEFNDVDLNKSISGKKIAVINGIINSISNKNILDSFNKSLEYLKDHGAIVSYIDVDIDLLKAIYPTYIIISCAEATSNNANLDGIKFGSRAVGDSYEEVVTNTRTNGFSEMIKRRFIIGSYSLLKENQNDLFFRAQKCRRLIVDAFNKVLNEYDAIYCPASPSVAPIENSKSGNKLSNEYLIADNWLAIGNFGGYPSVTLPIGFNNNLPFGANITGRIFDEDTVLTIAKKIEEYTGFYNLKAKDGTK